MNRFIVPSPPQGGAIPLSCTLRIMEIHSYNSRENEKGKEREMIRIFELTGLTQAELTEITSFILGIHIAGVFAGNVFFWALKEAFRLCEKLIDLFSDRLFRHIRKRRHR